MHDHGLSIARACALAGLPRTAWYRPPQDRPAADQPVIAALLALVARYTRWGLWKCVGRLRALGHRWNWKRIYRVYRALRLHLTRRRRVKRVPTGPRLPLEAPPILNRTWALDFMGDTLYDGRCYRILNVLDEGNREALAIEVDVSLPSARVVQVLDQLVVLYGAPTALRCDNGPEFLSAALMTWCDARGIRVQYIAPGKPQSERLHRAVQPDLS